MIYFTEFASLQLQLLSSTLNIFGRNGVGLDNDNGKVIVPRLSAKLSLQKEVLSFCPI